MSTYRFLFHLHTFYSHDGMISFEALYLVVKKYQITHLAVTEHNNMDSFQPLQKFFANKDYRPIIIPACEYTTPIGDIIVLNLAQKIEFMDYQSLMEQAKNLGGLLVLPHPYKRKGYPDDLVKALDFYEIFNLRGATRYFDNRLFGGIPFLYGADAHQNIDLPGIFNVYHSESDFFTTIRTQVPVPQLVRKEISLINKISKQISKIKVRFWGKR